MSFAAALIYPFQKAYVVTVFKIVLVLSIIIVIISALFPTTDFFYPISILYTFFVLGHTIQVSHNILHRKAVLPELLGLSEFRHTMLAIVASVIYASPLYLFLPYIFSTIAGDVRYPNPLVVLVFIVFAVIIMNVFIIGWIRYGIELNGLHLLDIPKNFVITFQKIKPLLRLWFFIFVFGIVYIGLMIIIHVTYQRISVTGEVGSVLSILQTTIHGILLATLYFLFQASNAYLFAGFARIAILEEATPAQKKRVSKQKRNS